MIPFPFNENRFSFFLFADRQLVGQLSTNPKSDRSLLSCLKVTQCSMSEIGDAPLYNSCSLPIPCYDNWAIASTLKMQIWIATNNRDVPRVMKTKLPATVMVFGVVLSEGHTMQPHFFESRLESQHQSVPGCAKECGDPLVQSGGRWQTLGVAAGLGAGPQIQRDPGLAFRRSALTLYPSLAGPPPPPTLTRWTTSFGHKSRTSPS